jgi:predicted DCC family thiol-disulfide oxidoreductase YuxK
VSWIIRRDRRRRFRFAPLQSPAGERLQLKYNLDPGALDTMILVEDGTAYLRSTAALRIVRDLGPPYSLVSGLIAVPAPVRDFIYDALAWRRYRWFGRKDHCMVPRPEVRDRFLLD